MNSCEIFLTRFRGALSTGNCEALTNILEKDAKEQLQIVSTEYLEFLVDGILGKDSLLCFLDSAFNNPDFVSRKDSDNVFIKSFQFLGLLIENFYQVSCFKQYICQIKDICYMVLCKKCNFYIQKVACHTFIKLIERFSNQDLKLDRILKQFVLHGFRVNTIKERRLIYCVLGKIIKHNESVLLSRVYVDAIFKRLRADALEEFVPGGLAQPSNSFHMYFNAISDMLDNAEPPYEIKDKFFQDSYGWIKSVSNLNNIIVLKSAIELLDRHMKCFRSLLYPDYQYWHRFLRRLSCEKATSDRGQHTLKTFYRFIGEILEEQSREESENVLLYFLDKFYEVFATANLDLITLRLTIFGYSRIVAACKTHLPEYHVRNMYSTITNCALPLCFSERSNSANVENVCCYQEALSKMLCHVSDVTTEKINVLIKLSTYTIKRFPDLEVSSNALAISSLISVICNLASTDRNLLQRYLDSTIYDGVAWSCSHTLALDAELQRELWNLQRPPISYKNYLSLWTRLLNVEKYERYSTVQLVAETMTNVCATLISWLDIRVKQQYEDTALSDVAFTQSAVNQTDFRVFMNLVDLYVDVMDASAASLYTDVIPHFLREIVRLSYKYPLISGFYKLARVALKIFDRTTEKEESEIKLVVSSYLANTLELLPTFSNELLIACLYLVLDAPGISYVVPSARLIPAFRIAFTMGLSDLELAYCALAALKVWTGNRRSREDERTNESLLEIVPHLESYLRSTESAVEISQELTTTKKARLKRIGLIDTECTLRNFQRQILLFLGSLDYDVLSSFLHERSLNTGTSWDRKDLLRYVLLLPDARLTLHFDRMLPRVITLARGSSDRRTRIAACEVLHSMVTLVIGSTVRRLSDLEDSIVTLYAPLCPALLALGCDTDEVVRDLFRPFTLQLMHWLSSRIMLLSSVTSLVLDCLFDSLCDDANSSLREFAGLCLAEFTSWSIKQASHERDMQSNVQQVVRKINHFALHPSARKRVAAAVAFNHLYVILREDEDIVSTYWLEMFYCFIRSMDGCENPSITKALNHIEKVMGIKADVLNVAARDRRKPHDFDDATLTHALYWLLSQCGVLDEHCRATCKELYVNISQYTVDGSAQEVTRTFVETYKMDRLNNIILSGLKPNEEDISTIHIKNLLKALDYYTWLIEKQLLPIENLFPVHTQEHAIFACIRQFSRQFLQTVRIAATTKFREFDELQTLQCKTVMATLNFAQVLLNVNDIVDVLPESLWNESLFALTIECVMHPVGFDVKNIQITDELPHVLETLLNAMSSRFNDILAHNFRRCLSNVVRECVPPLLNLHYLVLRDSYDEQIRHVNGLMILERCNWLDRTIPEISAFANRTDTIEQIFNFLVSENRELICSDLSAQMFEYLRALMKLQLLRHEASTIEILVRLMSNDTLIIGADLAKITHGEYFLNRFSNVIFTYVLTNADDVTFVLDKLSSDSPAFLLKWTEDMLLHLKRHRRALREHVNATVDVILRRFACLKSATAGSHTERLISIYSIAVRLVPEPTEIKRNPSYSELRNWIVQQVVESCDIEYKTQILRNFLVCLTDATDRLEDKIYLMYLYTLKDDRESLCPQLSNDMTGNAMKVVNCFETLLTLLSVTCSVVVLDYLINFAAGAGKSLFSDKLKEHLREYYRRETPNAAERVLCSLEMTYRRFIQNVNVQERLDVLREFLLPAFDCCDTPTIERFFERNIRELRAISHKDISNADVLLVSKIGCYQLLAIMCTRLEESKLIDADGAIVQKSGLDNVQTGRELLQSLLTDAMTVRELKIVSACRENVRLLHCSAYNFSLAVVSLKEEVKYYNLAFGENHQRNSFIWRNIIDCDKHYHLSQTFDKYPKNRETTVNIRSPAIDDGRTGETSSRRGYSHVHSYDLSSCSLSEDINAYDFNKCALLPSSVRGFKWERSTMNVVLESDDFNEHECMPSICGILRRFSGLPKVSEMELAEPKWLKSFVSSMQKDVPRNIRLFMMKIVCNLADTALKPYAKFMLSGIAQAVADYLRTDDLNYIVTDVLEVLTAWRDGVTDDEITDSGKIRNLFNALVGKVLRRRTSNKRVYNYNLGLIHTMAKKWRGCLTESIACLVGKMGSAQEAAIDLIVRLLRDDDEMAREIIDEYLTEDIVDLLLRPLRDWNAAEEDVLRCCECLGWHLRLQRDTARRENVKQRIFDILSSPPRTTQRSIYTEKQLKRIVVLCRTYPDLAVDYITVVIDITSAEKNRAYCLEVFAMSIPQLRNAASIVSNLHRVELQSVLANRESFCETIALRIVRESVDTAISPADLLPYVKLVIPYIEDNSMEHRGLAYDVLMSVYKKYSADSDDESATTLRSESTRNLLAALLDPSQELQARVLRFWTEETDLGTDRSKERLIAVLDLRTKTNARMSLKEEDAYTLLVPLLMLQLASLSRDYTEKVFDVPLHNCTYEDYRIAVRWRRPNLSLATPMFVNSLASQMSCTLSVDNNYGTYDPSHEALRLRATQDLQFEPTMIDDDEAANMDDNSLLNDTFDRPTTSSRQSRPTSTVRRFPRFLKSPDVGEKIRNQHIQKNLEWQEMIKQENIKQRNSASLTRDYRIGDFPDIQIPHSSLIKPLQQLIKLDGLIRKDVAVFLFCSLIEETVDKENSDNFHRSVVTSLKRILHDGDKDSAFNAVILETLLKLNVTDFDSCDIVRVSKRNGLNALGVLLLERSLRPDASYLVDLSPPSEKKMKRRNEDDTDDNDRARIDKWAQLASLYKSLDDVDSVLSIFREQSYDKNVQEATVANASGDWSRARKAFERAYESTKVVPSLHEYCVEGLFGTMDDLCDWSKINELVIQANGDLTSVWNSPCRDWMITRMCDAYVQMLADDPRSWETSDDDLRMIESWINDPSRMEHVKSQVGENLVVFLLKGPPRKTGDLLYDLLDKTGEQWVRLNSLSTELGMRKLRKLQLMSDLDATLKVLRYTDNADYLDKMATVLNYWAAKAPTTRDNLVQWNKLAAYRRYSSMLFDYTLDNIADEDCVGRAQDIRIRIRQANHHMWLGIIDAALKQKHRYIAKKHSNYLRNVSAELQPRRMLLEAKIKCMCANLEADAREKMSHYAGSWSDSHGLLNDDVGVNTSIAVREHIGALAWTIERLTRESDVFAKALLTVGHEEGGILRDIGAEESDNLAGVRELLLQYGLNKLRSCSDKASTVTAASRSIGEHYYALTRHCYSRLTDGRVTSEAEKNEIFLDFVFATLQAMYHDYHEATHYFPCLLRPEWLLRNDTAQQIFQGKSVKPQPWLFLRWRDLLFSHLGTSIAFLVVPIVERLAEKYPDAVAYTYHLAVEKNPALSRDRATQRIRELLRGKVAEVRQFLSAIQYVAQPELYLKYHLNEATKQLSEGGNALASLLSKVYRPAAGPRPGSVYNVIAKYESMIRALNPADCDATRASIQRIKDLLDESLKSRASKKRLKEYSPFLHAYVGGDIEIPGQYSGNREPMPRYHAKIARIDPIVDVMRSLRKPIRISMIGENGREYKFLVKFGEDLTIDHGLQQLYATMNRTLSNDTACRQRRLMIDTYEVIPLSRSFGLIQWIEDTKSLEDLVWFTLSKTESNQCENILKNYMRWIENAAPSCRRLSDQYKAATVRYNQTEVKTKMEQLIAKTKKSALRDAFTVISPSPESFVTLRRNFVASYATMCAAHWISGVGDRHLQNTLVVVGSGRCLGIDFGYVFGSGICGPVPELVPFRLTPQILELLQPFTEKHLLSTIMTHVMRALRDDKGPILACMDIFVHKPVYRSNINGEDTDTDSIRSFKRNIMTVEKKLNGIHPSLITVKQLKEAHNDEYFTKCRAIIIGNESMKVRGAVQNDCLTPTEQVNCLLDQATDLNVLGRMYSKWQPWL
ncbi:PREDICTED: DNA-dependent protein kinase catalytic subunit-like [Dinoponera quadriceps]|uniref:DNA-dependent protein kinase catalytic subunit-like n=1 Tax=Dinoponera quadriceps TaxID=609295 RepID=A0A6P3X6M6_DINQU|nr:PREDICTED: DNA-dependent protein kinase catalytic subunit-like [Dinoponera quadriceps]